MGETKSFWMRAVAIQYTTNAERLICEAGPLLQVVDYRDALARTSSRSSLSAPATTGLF